VLQIKAQKKNSAKETFFFIFKKLPLRIPPVMDDAIVKILQSAEIPISDTTLQLWSTGFYPTALLVAGDPISRMMLQGRSIDPQLRCHWRVAKTLLKNLGYSFTTAGVIGCIAMDPQITLQVAIGLRDALLTTTATSQTMTYIVRVSPAIPPAQRTNPFSTEFGAGPDRDTSGSFTMLCAVDKEVVSQRRSQLGILMSLDRKNLQDQLELIQRKNAIAASMGNQPMPSIYVPPKEEPPPPKIRTNNAADLLKTFNEAKISFIKK